MCEEKAGDGEAREREDETFAALRTPGTPTNHTSNKRASGYGATRHRAAGCGHREVADRRGAGGPSESASRNSDGQTLHPEGTGSPLDCCWAWAQAHLHER